MVNVVFIYFVIAPDLRYAWSQGERVQHGWVANAREHHTPAHHQQRRRHQRGGRGALLGPVLTAEERPRSGCLTCAPRGISWVGGIYAKENEYAGGDTHDGTVEGANAGWRPHGASTPHHEQALAGNFQAQCKLHPADDRGWDVFQQAHQVGGTEEQDTCA